MELPGRGGPAEAKFLGEDRRTPGTNGQERDDPAASRIGQQLDPLPVPFRHVVHAAMMPGRTARPINRDFAPAYAGRRARSARSFRMVGTTTESTPRETPTCQVRHTARA